MQVAAVQRCALTGIRTAPCSDRRHTRLAVSRATVEAPRRRAIIAAATEEAQAAHDVASSNGTPPAASTNSVAFEELTDLIRMVHETDIVELELKSKRFSLCVRKKEALEKAEPLQLQMPQMQMQGMQGQPMYAPHMQTPPAFGPAPQQAPQEAQKPAAAEAPPAETSVDEGVEVSSPMSGTMYRAPAPGEPPFVQEGDRVSRGQTICIIEAMKLMNEIEAECDGIIVKFLAANASNVTPGQAIALVKP